MAVSHHRKDMWVLESKLKGVVQFSMLIIADWKKRKTAQMYIRVHQVNQMVTYMRIVKK